MIIFGDDKSLDKDMAVEWCEWGLSSLWLCGVLRRAHNLLTLARWMLSSVPQSKERTILVPR